MQKSSIYLGLVILVFSLFFFTKCINVDQTDTNKDYEKNRSLNSISGIDISTLPGNNFFTLSTGGIYLYSLSLSGAAFLSVKGKCDTSTTQGRFVISAQSADTNLSYTSVILAAKPDESMTIPIVAEGTDLNNNSAWVTITIIKSNKTWRAYKGNLNLLVDGSNITASFDTVRVECTSNITDTTFFKMSGVLFCK